jgi:hypothetical protein
MSASVRLFVSAPASGFRVSSAETYRTFGQALAYP